jgi:meso-butanediol dehydrogenase/(S,S)-butanediol dehydrogenase/diacetyl reductase
LTNKLKNEVAIVTGAASGIGKETAITLARNGAFVVCFDIDVEGLKDTHQTIKDLGLESEYFKVDVTDEESINQAIDKVVQSKAKITILVNCAAMILFNDIETCTKQQWNKIFEVNVLGYFLCLKGVSKYMKETGGAIVQFSSSAAISGSVYASPAYIASKSAIIGFSKHVATHWSQYGIRCNTICPGWTETPMTLNVQVGFRRDLESVKNIPLGRSARPDDMASVVLFLVSEDSKYITGQTFHVNGGKYMYNT